MSLVGQFRLSGRIVRHEFARWLRVSQPDYFSRIRFPDNTRLPAVCPALIFHGVFVFRFARRSPKTEHTPGHEERENWPTFVFSRVRNGNLRGMERIRSHSKRQDSFIGSGFSRRENFNVLGENWPTFVFSRVRSPVKSSFIRFPRPSSEHRSSAPESPAARL